MWWVLWRLRGSEVDGEWERRLKRKRVGGGERVVSSAGRSVDRERERERDMLNNCRGWCCYEVCIEFVCCEMTV